MYWLSQQQQQQWKEKEVAEPKPTRERRNCIHKCTPDLTSLKITCKQYPNQGPRILLSGGILSATPQQEQLQAIFSAFILELQKSRASELSGAHKSASQREGKKNMHALYLLQLPLHTDVVVVVFFRGGYTSFFECMHQKGIASVILVAGNSALSVHKEEEPLLGRRRRKSAKLKSNPTMHFNAVITNKRRGEKGAT